jgi:hypothetical protein
VASMCGHRQRVAVMRRRVRAAVREKQLNHGRVASRSGPGQYFAVLRCRVGAAVLVGRLGRGSATVAHAQPRCSPRSPLDRLVRSKTKALTDGAPGGPARLREDRRLALRRRPPPQRPPSARQPAAAPPRRRSASAGLPGEPVSRRRARSL